MQVEPLLDDLIGIGRIDGAIKRKARQIQRDYDAQRIQGKTTSTGTTVFVENEADPGELPARDDRY